MIIYSASILISQPNKNLITDYPITSTSLTYSTFESFVGYCKCHVLLRPEFESSNVSINAIACLVLDDGTLTKVNSEIINYRNAEKRILRGLF